MWNLRDVEVAPIAIGDKGVAVRKFLDEPAMRGALPIYFGDDFSDEPAFAAARKGIPILVGKRRTTRANIPCADRRKWRRRLPGWKKLFDEHRTIAKILRGRASTR